VDLATRAFTLPVPATRVVVFALFLGFLAGSALALMLEGMDRAIKRREDIEERLRIPVLVTIPQIKVQAPPRRVLSRLGLSKNTSRTDVTRRSVAAESFRQLTAALFLGRNGDTPQRLLVTSAVQGEGKTTAAVNLGIALAQQGQRVLLVDCDLYNPKVHTVFSLPISPGLIETVVSSGMPGDAVYASGLSGLFVMPAGNTTNEPGEVASSPRFQALIEDMLHEFSVIILDAPPVLAVADPTVLTLSADAVLLVVRAGMATPDDVGEALRTLSSVGAPVAGAVLNDPEGKVRQYGGYSYGYAHASVAP
jgi:capsular exopolysaccharide synthesis family protein